MTDLGKPLAAHEANAIYDVLVAECGANETARVDFVHAQATRFIDEYRFQGSLGFGGKFRRGVGRRRDENHAPGDWGETWYVDCYSEDRNIERDDMVFHANAQLEVLYRAVNESNLTGKWLVQVGKGRAAYDTKYAFRSDEKFRAIKWYEALNTHSGHKKRLVDPNGNVHLRVIT